MADDDPEMLTAVAEALRRQGFEVEPAESGAALVDQLVREGPFDLIVTDISMPWMDGLKTLRSMRTAGLATPAIVITALGDGDLPAQVQALGPNTLLLRKPFGFDDLDAAVTKLMPRSRSADLPS